MPKPILASLTVVLALTAATALAATPPKLKTVTLTGSTTATMAKSTKTGVLLHKGPITTSLGRGTVVIETVSKPNSKLVSTFTITLAKGKIKGSANTTLKSAGGTLSYNGTAKITGGTATYKRASGAGLKATGRSTDGAKHISLKLSGTLKY